MKAPRIKTKLPGPKAMALIKKDRRYSSPSYTRAYPLVVERGRGAVIEDADGNLFLDFNAGIAVAATGHCHPRVVRAIKEQASKFIHMSGTDFYYRPMVDLAEKLGRITPGDKNKKVFFGNSGTEAIEGSLKLARYVKKRPNVLAFLGGFHGRTLGALSLTASKAIQRRYYVPFVPGVAHVPFGYCYRCAYNREYPGCDIDCVKYIEEVIFKTIFPPEDICAIVVEPIQGEGGYIIPPLEFHQRLKRLAEKYDILFIADEVQSGMGRTGKMLAFEHWGVIPDIIALAKGIASGMPLSAFITSSKLMTWEPGAHGNTFGGNPISCMASLETIRLLEEGLMENAWKIGDFLLEGLVEIQKDHELLGEVVGKGLMIGIEIVKDRHTKEMDPKMRDKIIQRCFEKGLLLLGCGASRLRFSPPLVVTQEQAASALEIFEEVLDELEGKK